MTHISIEYQKGCDNVATDALSQVTSKLNAETMKFILNGVTIGTLLKEQMLMSQQWPKLLKKDTN